MTNRWEDVSGTFFAEGVGEVIAKMHLGVIADHNTVKATYTTALTPDAVERLALTASPFPGLIQPFVSKRREWRVTVVGDQVFPASIYCSPDAQEDWRRVQLDPQRVQFRSEPLPDGVAERCVKFLARSSLGYGAFDLVETPDGEIVFLECNPSGQFMWLAEQLGLPIADAIADALVAIAAKRE
jgi:glutathione synthase/RimK-type ligase-like ATP-grasp enzyme